MAKCRVCGNDTGSRKVICYKCELIICDEYIKNQLSLRKVSVKYNIDDNIVKRILNENNYVTRNYSEAGKLRLVTNETKKKMSIARKKLWTSEYRKKLSKSLMNHKVSEETKKKISEANKGRTGVHYKGVFGKSHPGWHGGFYSEHQRWKLAVKLRDHFCCQVCQINEFEHQQNHLQGAGLSVHHIDGDRTNNRIENGITLCSKHHSRLHALKKWSKTKTFI